MEKEYPLCAEAVVIALMGDNIPAHDETLDLAEEIGRDLDKFQHYITDVRDADQAKAAVIELLEKLLVAARK